MSLDVDSVAQLAANILYRRFRRRENDENCAFWTDAARCRADELAAFVGIEVGASDTHESLCMVLRQKLDSDLIFAAALEKNFREFSFSLLIQTLAAKVAAEVQRKLPGAKTESSLIHRIRRLMGGRAAACPVVEAAVKRVQALVEGCDAPCDCQTFEVALFFNRREAGQVALAFEEPIPFQWTLLLELDAVLESRRLRKVEPSASKTVAEAQLVGLSLSGGGIRSATLNLGILQALSELHLFRYLDYVSTVSGGGYIGSWLHAWVRRTQDPDKVREALSPKDSPNPTTLATHPIKWLRQYSNYLAPRLGLLSADTGSILTIWARNTLLNMIVIVLALTAVLMVPRGLRIVFNLVEAGYRAGWIAVLPLAVGVFVIQRNLRSFAQTDKRKDRLWFHQKSIHLGVILPIFLSSMLVAAWLSEVARQRARLFDTTFFVAACFFLLLCFVSFFGDYYQHFFDGRPKPPLIGCWTAFAAATVIFNGMAAALGGCALFAVERMLARFAGHGATWHHFVWGPVAVAAVYSLVIIVYLGLFGRNLPDDRREWWSRAGAILLVWMSGWVAIAGMAIYGPWLLIKLVNYNYGPHVASVLGMGWVGTTLAGVLRARSDTTGSKDREPSLSLITRIAPPVFVAGLLLVVSLGIHLVTVKLLGFAFPGFPSLEANYFDLLNWWDPEIAWMACAICLLASFLFAWRIDINEFSMHRFYENRLVRCYLGASRRHRQPNRFTGFDPEDDFNLADLSPFSKGDMPGYAGPFPIINAALNLVSGEELAWQERKAESFSFTPLFSGYAAGPAEERAGGPHAGRGFGLYAYRPTAEYAFPGRGIRVGKAMAVSGAAVSPNAGYHTTAAAAFLLTVFNVRLGWWMGNPRHQTAWRRSGPGVGLGYLLVELAAAANSKSKYVYLSDGGHFENLGIYELVRRRCRYIIACDGGQDEHSSFEDLGNAIRKCRADFGIDIEIDLSSIRPRPADDSGQRALSGSHCAVGTVVYPEGPHGTLVYLKASLTGDEPAEVQEYVAVQPAFPHQSTTDQFFDESQFESYRRLGYHIGMTTFAEIVKRRGGACLSDTTVDADRAGFFGDVGRRWYAASTKTAAFFTRHAEALTNLTQRLRQDQDLAFLEAQMIPEWERMMTGASGMPIPTSLGLPETSEQRRAGFHFCNALLQLMEDVYLDLNLEEESRHPDNAGWMNLFHHWSWSAMFRATWLVSASCYGARFRSFCEHRVGLDLASIGSIDILQATGPADSRFNFREKELLAGGGFDWFRQRVFLFQISVNRPDPPHAVMMDLTVGLVVLSASGRLAYFRVQDHLRGIGLARRALDAMVVDGKCPIDLQPEWQALPPDFPEPVHEQAKERLQRMIESAHIRRIRA